MKATTKSHRIRTKPPKKTHECMRIAKGKNRMPPTTIWLYAQSRILWGVQKKCFALLSVRNSILPVCFHRNAVMTIVLLLHTTESLVYWVCEWPNREGLSWVNCNYFAHFFHLVEIHVPFCADLSFFDSICRTEHKMVTKFMRRWWWASIMSLSWEGLSSPYQ